MRIIDADELMEHVWRDKLDSRELIAKMIDNAPTVKEISTKIPINIFEQLISQKLKTGHWISHREYCENLGVMPSGLGAYEWCSNCDCGIDVREWHRNHYNYCPNCGARMVEPQESERV